MINLKSALNDAVENVLFPLDPTTATMAWLIARMPKHHSNRGWFEQQTPDHTIKGEIAGNIIKILETPTMTNMTPIDEPVIRMKI